ncbi:MAG TPA: serine/threonine-protein kinase, partial [Vicinamibacteria bacterium]
MSLADGMNLGPYEVKGPLGVGGMGEVYRAHDARLGRDVAVKVLPASFAADADRLRRFEQEARATSALNHPNILAIYDLGSHQGAPYVVSELLEGETLRDRIGATPLPLRKALDYASQVARGLAAAHEKGIVHRDLKPDNLFITKDGRVKILDFGLAKLVGGDMLTEGETNTAGMVPGTDAGQVLGTVGYMSPEQVRARPVDHRSDIFSFGAVLYEMLSGKRAFRGASAVETMNAILKEDPPSLTETNRQLPPGLERIVSHCLEKSPEERFQSARDIAFDLEQVSGSTATATPIRGTVRARFGLPLLLGGAALALGLGVAAGRLTTERGRATLSIERLTFRRESIRTARFAPDGRGVVFEATVSGQQAPAIFTALDGSAEARSLGLPDTRLGGISSKGELAVLLRRREGAARTLAIIPTSGGAPREVVEDVDEADWSPDGASLAVLRWTGGGLMRLEFPAGKEIYAASQLNNIRVSPGGDHVAFTEHPVFGDNRGDVAIIDRGGRKTTLSSGW